MIAVALLLVTAATLTVRPTSGSAVKSTATSVLFCRSDARNFGYEAAYRMWRSASVRVATSSFSGQCVVNVSLAASSERLQPGRPQRLLLVKIERLRLTEVGDSFYAMSNYGRRTSGFCSSATPCDDARYLWSSEPVNLYLYVKSATSVASTSYEASLIITEAMNVCGLTSRAGELLVRSGRSEYAFAPDVRDKALAPNNVTCTLSLEYSLTVRPSDAGSDPLIVTALACPQIDSCGTLLLNGQSCRDGAIVSSSQPGSYVTLRYWYRRCDNDHFFSGFVMSAEIDSFPDPQRTTAASSLPDRASTVTGRTTARVPTVREALSAASFSSGRVSVTSSSATAVATTGATATRARGSPGSSTMFRLVLVAGAAVTDSSSPQPTAGRALSDEHNVADPSTVTIIAVSVTIVVTAALAAIGVVVALLIRRRRRLLSHKPQSNTTHRGERPAVASEEEIAMVDNDLYGVALFPDRLLINAVLR